MDDIQLLPQRSSECRLCLQQNNETRRSSTQSYDSDKVRWLHVAEHAKLKIRPNANAQLIINANPKCQELFREHCFPMLKRKNISKAVKRSLDAASSLVTRVIPDDVTAQCSLCDRKITSKEDDLQMYLEQHIWHHLSKDERDAVTGQLLRAGMFRFRCSYRTHSSVDTCAFGTYSEVRADEHWNLEHGGSRPLPPIDCLNDLLADFALMRDRCFPLQTSSRHQRNSSHSVAVKNSDIEVLRLQCDARGYYTCVPCQLNVPNPFEHCAFVHVRAEALPYRCGKCTSTFVSLEASMFHWINKHERKFGSKMILEHDTTLSADIERNVSLCFAPR